MLPWPSAKKPGDARTVGNHLGFPFPLLLYTVLDKVASKVTSVLDIS